MMRKINEIHVCFLLSLVTHVGIFGSEMLNIEKLTKKAELEITFEIEPPEYLPDAYQITEEKKIEKILKEKKLKVTVEHKEIEEVIEEVKKDFPEPDLLDEELKKSLLRYQDSIKQKIQEIKNYPRWALRAKHQGIVQIVFNVLSSGEVSGLKLVRSSGFDELDHEALESVKRAIPFSSFPERLAEDKIRIEIEIVFALEGKHFINR